MPEHAAYTDEQWAGIAAVLHSAGAQLSDDDLRACRAVLDSVGHFFSWKRPGMAKKKADAIKTRLASMRRRIAIIENAELGTPEAMTCAASLEADLVWLFALVPAAKAELDRFRPRRFTGWFLLLSTELDAVEDELTIQEAHRQDNPSASSFHKWLSSLAEVWERSGLKVRASGSFPAFVRAARTPGIHGAAITETTVRDFVLREWGCRTLESS